MARGCFWGLVALLGCLAASASAADPRQITLTDGSVVSGEIESVHDGIYTVRSALLGTLTLKDSDIRSIETPAAASAGENAASAPSVAENQLDAVQHRILDDDGLMNSVTALKADPQFQDVLNDPDIMDALRAGNVDVLENNPKVRRLVDDPRLQDIVKKLGQ